MTTGDGKQNSASLLSANGPEALLREIAIATGSIGAALVVHGEDEEPRIEAEWSVPAALADAWHSGHARPPRGDKGFEVIAAIAGEGPWCALTVSVPRHSAATTLHVLRAGDGAPSEADLRMAAVVSVQLGALLDRDELLRELRASSEAERDAVTRLRDLYDDIQEGILVLDASGLVTFSSRRACHILRRSPHQLLGHGLLAYVDPGDRPDVVHGFLSAREGARATGEFRLVQGEALRIVEFTARRDGAGEVPSAAVRMIIRDVTEARQREADTIHREKLASVGQLAAGVAHEINNPIAFVLSNYSFLSRRISDLVNALAIYRTLAHTPEVARYSGAIARMESGLELDSMLADIPELLADSLDGLERVRRIVGDMRVFARKDPESPVQVDVASILDTALGMASPVVRMKAKVVREVMGPLPPLQAWPGRLTQCVLNLVVNAAQAIPAGNVEGNCITVRAWADAKGVSLSVSDTGSGIRPEDRARLFTPFFTTKAPGEGTGLGLALAWDAVRRHGGRISVDSIVGTGTTFTIALPFDGVNTAPEPDVSASLASEGMRLVG